MAKRKDAQEETVVVEQNHQHSAPVWETYQKPIMYAVGAVVLAIVLFFGYKKMIAEPKQTEALAAMWKAQAMFDRDSFKMALENPGVDADGFIAIIDKYSGTPAGNVAKYYAGVCYLQTGDMDNAITYMEDFDADDAIFYGMKYGILGDCYSEKQDFSKALSMYEKASETKNEAIASVYLKKFGMLNEKQGNKEAAVKAYERLRRDFPNPNSQDWRDIEKYIARAGGGQQ